MKRMTPSDSSGSRSDSEIGFVLRAAHRKSGPEMLRHVAAANAGPASAAGRAAKAKATKGTKAKTSAKRRKS